MIGCGAQPLTSASSQALVHVTEAWRHDDSGGQMIAALGQYREPGQLGQSDVHAERRAFAFPAAHPAFDVGIDRAARDQPVEQQFRIDAGDNICRAPSFAARDNAGRAGALAVALDDHLLDRGIQEDVDPGLAARPRHRLGDRAHAADRMAPGSGHARRFAEQMVEQDVGGARAVG